MNCEEIMKRSVVTLRPSDTAQLAAQLMFDANVGFLPVVQDGKAIGLLTDRDIALRIVRQGKPSSTSVGDIMTQEIVFCNPWDSIEAAADTMAENQVARLLINDEDGKLVGVISLSDLPSAISQKAFDTFKEITDRETQPYP